MITPITDLKLPDSDLEKSKYLISLFLHGFLFEDELANKLLQIGLPPDKMKEYEEFVLELYEAQKKECPFKIQKMSDLAPSKSLLFFVNSLEKLKKYDLNIWRHKSLPDNTRLEYKSAQFPGSNKFIFSGKWMEELGFVKIGNYLFGRTIQPYVVSDKTFLNNVIIGFDVRNIKTYEDFINSAHIGSALTGVTGFGDFSVYTLTKDFCLRYDMYKWVPEDQPIFAAMLFSSKERDELHEIGKVVLDVKTLDKEIFEL